MARMDVVTVNNHSVKMHNIRRPQTGAAKSEILYLDET
jgi:hypothetical protein